MKERWNLKRNSRESKKIKKDKLLERKKEKIMKEENERKIDKANRNTHF